MDDRENSTAVILTQSFLPGIVFMRGGSVGILTILVAEETGAEYSVCVIQVGFQENFTVDDYHKLPLLTPPPRSLSSQDSQQARLHRWKSLLVC